MKKHIAAFLCMSILFLGLLYLLWDPKLEKSRDILAQNGIFETWEAPSGDPVVSILGQRWILDQDVLTRLGDTASHTFVLSTYLLPGFVRSYGGQYLHHTENALATLGQLLSSEA